MTLIKIKRETIRKNPDYGMPGMFVPLRKSVSFTYYGAKLPDYLAGFRGQITTHYQSEDKTRHECTYSSLPEDVLRRLWEEERGNLEGGLSFQNEVEYVPLSGIGQRPYLYSYTNPVVACLHCGAKHRLSLFYQDSMMGMDGPIPIYNICPTCECPNDFDFTYEDIDEVVKELKL